jgi:hypothetical protein
LATIIGRRSNIIIQFCWTFGPRKWTTFGQHTTRKQSMWPPFNIQSAYDEHKTNEKNKTKNLLYNLMRTRYKANLIVFSGGIYGQLFSNEKKKKKKKPKIKVVDRKYTTIIQAIINTLTYNYLLVHTICI